MATQSQTSLSQPVDRSVMLWQQMNDETLSQRERDKAADDFFFLWRKLALDYGYVVIGGWYGHRDDINQTCYLALCKARAEWEPDRGPFPLILKYHVKDCLRDWLRRQEMVTRSHKIFRQNYSDKDNATLGKIDCVSWEQQFDPTRDDDVRERYFSDETAEFADRVTLQVAVREIAARLPAHQRQIVKEYYGLDGDEPKTLRQTADIVGRSHESVRAILKRANQSIHDSLHGCV